MIANKKKIIDLSMTIEQGMQTFNSYWHTKVEIVQLASHDIENRETRKIVLGTHTGTHIDAPRHFIPNGKTIEELDLENLNGDALVIDFSQIEEKHEVTKDELISKIGSKKLDRIIVRFDWDRHYGTKKYYTDHPFFSEDACSWLVKNECKVFGMDTPQPDNPLNGKGSILDAPNHKILLGGEVILVEYLVNLKSIQSQEINLIVAPLKIKSGDGAPARCFAIEK